MTVAAVKSKFASMDYRKIITMEPGKRGRKPCIRGLRITVSDVLEYLAGGMTEDEILRAVSRTSRAKISAPASPSRQTVSGS